MQDGSSEPGWIKLLNNHCFVLILGLESVKEMLWTLKQCPQRVLSNASNDWSLHAEYNVENHQTNRLGRPWARWNSARVGGIAVEYLGPRMNSERSYSIQLCRRAHMRRRVMRQRGIV